MTIASSPPHPEELLDFKVGSAFYRPQMRYIRDLGVLAAIVYRQQWGQLRVLETMSASGIRSLRYGLEAEAEWLWVNDANPELHPLLQENLERHLSPHSYQVTALDAQAIFAYCGFHHDGYDLVDVDGFGKAFNFLPTVWSALGTHGLLYWTATDGQVLGGHNPDRCLQRYGSYGRSFPCTQEQGMRIVLGSLAAAAQQRGITLQPIFSTFTGQTYRLLVQRVCRLAGTWSDRYGFLGYCDGCGGYQTVAWRKLGRTACPHHDPPHPLTLSGPLWLGPLHHPETLHAMKTIAAERSLFHLIPLLDRMIAEALLPPYHYSLGELGKWNRADPPNRDRFLQALRDQGYLASVTHWNPEAFKTNAPWVTVKTTGKKI
ncbi:MAG: hypothetical protein RLZZ435_2946 [Cyanobacteriota bacterium]